MSLTSFTSKQLRFTLVLSPLNANPIFPMTGSNTLVVSNCRASVTIQTVPLVPTNASVKIFGMLPADMQALTTIFFNVTKRFVPNNLIIEQNSGAGWTQVFSGIITDAQPRYRAMPNVFFEIVAMTGYQWQITPVPPLSYPGTVPVATIAQQIAGNMGYSLDNTAGVTANVTNGYFPGTNTDQLNRLCQMSRTQYVLVTSLDSNNQPTGTVYIYPTGKFVPSIPMVQLSPTSGLDGYPELEKFGLVITSLFNPTITAGGRIQVADSVDVPNANGIWSPFIVAHTLEPNMPGGRWHSVSSCLPVPS